MKITVVIPTRNEEGCIGRVLGEIPRTLVNEVIVIDGHSTDRTVIEAKKSMKSSDKVLDQIGNGYGAALIQGMRAARGDVIVMMDADGSHDPKDIVKIIKKMEKGAEYVMASRYMLGGRSDDDTWLRWFGNKLFTWMTNVVHGSDITDSLYLFTAIRKESMEKLKLKSHGFEFCTEIVVKAHKAGLKFAEVPTIERARFAGKSKVNSFYHGMKILRMILRNYK